MIIAIIVVGSVILGMYLTYKEIIEDYGFTIGNVVMTLITGFIGLLVGCLIAVGVGNVVTANANIKYVDVKTENIYALKDGLGISGNSFLGTGTIDSKLKVYYITKDEFNAIHIQSKDLDSSVSIVQDGQKYVVTKQSKYTNKIVEILFDTPMSDDKYEFHIPEGSITTDIKIDLN